MLRSMNDLENYTVGATDGDIGHVHGLLIDEETWAIRHIAINAGNWWVGHKVLIAPQWIKDVSWSDRSVSVDLTRASIKGAPSYDSTADLNRERESGLYQHYGRPGYWTSGTEPGSESGRRDAQAAHPMR